MAEGILKFKAMTNSSKAGSIEWHQLDDTISYLMHDPGP